MARHPAAFINAIADEGSKAEAVKYLQEIWDDLCEAQKRIKALEERLELTYSDGTKVDIGSLDGIGCRDETIRLQDEKIARYEERIKKLQARV